MVRSRAVKITYADGSVRYQQPYGRKELRRIVGRSTPTQRNASLKRYVRPGRAPAPRQPFHPRYYSDYLRTEHWNTFRKKYYKENGRRCVACGTREKVHLHHLRYNRLGAERHEDVMPLCHDHHFAIHRFSKENPKITLAQATERWLAGFHASKSMDALSNDRESGKSE